eukprot:gnl/MRDRNA2_/MRDRNA2_133269_c0_seq1.p1 gnl/MRDRNA2_/MRDRNA2_133269_c0~~gnl/MRDRNA2_/MRDRNA2_133269_c0_seq1.p1  ORF type:complete len:442 (-),score=93.10 gnl/MRDRNA2_/MRDRNA2_133269_c0_seq1:7-1332(-)
MAHAGYPKSQSQKLESAGNRKVSSSSTLSDDSARRKSHFQGASLHVSTADQGHVPPWDKSRSRHSIAPQSGHIPEYEVRLRAILTDLEQGKSCQTADELKALLVDAREELRDLLESQQNIAQASVKLKAAAFMMSASAPPKLESKKDPRRSIAQFLFELEAEKEVDKKLSLQEEDGAKDMREEEKKHGWPHEKHVFSFGRIYEHTNKTRDHIASKLDKIKSLGEDAFQSGVFVKRDKTSHEVVAEQATESKLKNEGKPQELNDPLKARKTTAGKSHQGFDAASFDPEVQAARRSRISMAATGAYHQDLQKKLEGLNTSGTDEESTEFSESTPHSSRAISRDAALSHSKAGGASHSSTLESDSQSSATTTSHTAAASKAKGNAPHASKANKGMSRTQKVAQKTSKSPQSRASVRFAKQDSVKEFQEVSTHGSDGSRASLNQM